LRRGADQSSSSRGPRRINRTARARDLNYDCHHETDATLRRRPWPAMLCWPCWPELCPRPNPCRSRFDTVMAIRGS
jgi:hypothetical protein